MKRNSTLIIVITAIVVFIIVLASYWSFVSEAIDTGNYLVLVVTAGCLLLASILYAIGSKRRSTYNSEIVKREFSSENLDEKPFLTEILVNNTNAVIVSGSINYKVSSGKVSGPIIAAYLCVGKDGTNYNLSKPILLGVSGIPNEGSVIKNQNKLSVTTPDGNKHEIEFLNGLVYQATDRSGALGVIYADYKAREGAEAFWSAWSANLESL